MALVSVYDSENMLVCRSQRAFQCDIFSASVIFSPYVIAKMRHVIFSDYYWFLNCPFDVIILRWSTIEDDLYLFFYHLLLIFLSWSLYWWRQSTKEPWHIYVSRLLLFSVLSIVWWTQSKTLLSPCLCLWDLNRIFGMLFFPHFYHGNNIEMKEIRFCYSIPANRALKQVLAQQNSVHLCLYWWTILVCFSGFYA